MNTSLISSQTDSASDYVVLARKYRPRTFADLVGQDAVVRTLSNAIRNNRLAHAYILTGVRGVGKTSTARIMAKALNCPARDGSPAPSVDPDPASADALAIDEGRHVDVLEIDAASRTGVGDIREIIDTVKYRPVQGKFKVYIIDEVHMLSTAAFNALLKTLEEPPAHVKFIFATTEIRKVPVTVLSRCQRFDLRRLDMTELTRHLLDVATREGGTLDDAAAQAMARAADGSVRDGLSLLDQALVLGQKKVTLPLVEEMLGLVDRTEVIRLMQLCFDGEAAPAMAQLDALYRKGADALTLCQDMLEATQTLTRILVAGDAVARDLSPSEFSTCQELARDLSIPLVGRFWQALLKGLAEIQQAPKPFDALSMIVVRLCYMSTLPTPDQVVAETGTKPDSAPRAVIHSGGSGENIAPHAANVSSPRGGAATAPALDAAPMAMRRLDRFEDVVALFVANREAKLVYVLEHQVEVLKCEHGRLELALHDAPKDFIHHLSTALARDTGTRWVVTVAASRGGATRAQKNAQEQQVQTQKMHTHPVVRKVLQAFPDSKIVAIRPDVAARADAGHHGDTDYSAESLTEQLE